MHRSILRAVVPAVSAVFSVFVLLHASLATAAEAADTMLVVRNVADPDHTELRLSEADLLELPQATLNTGNEFVDGVVEFEGPLVRDVIELVGVEEATIAHMVAANDYSVDIPIRDFYDYDVILALYADGKRLSLRDKGPIWVMYPIDRHEELQDPLYNPRLIWQLTTMELR